MRRAALVLLGLALAVAFAVTLSPHNTKTSAHGSRVVGIARHKVGLPSSAGKDTREADIVGNVLLFLPLGALGALAFPRRPGRVVVALAATSMAIESIQAIALPSRVASFKDIETNSLGGAIGVALVVVTTAGVAALRQRSRTRPPPTT